MPAAEFACEHQSENGGEAWQEILPHLFPLFQTLSSQAVAAKRGGGALAARQQVRQIQKVCNFFFKKYATVAPREKVVCWYKFMKRTRYADGPDCFITLNAPP